MAEEAKVKVGDIWQSRGGKLSIRVDKIEPQYKGSSWINVHWTGVNRRESGRCGEHNFTRGRTLIERDGKKVK